MCSNWDGQGEGKAGGRCPICTYSCSLRRWQQTAFLVTPGSLLAAVFSLFWSLQNWSNLASTGNNLQGLRKKEHCIWISRDSSYRHIIKVSLGEAFRVYFLCLLWPWSFQVRKGIIFCFNKKMMISSLFSLSIFHAMVNLPKFYLHLTIYSIFSLIYLSI